MFKTLRPVSDKFYLGRCTAGPPYSCNENYNLNKNFRHLTNTGASTGFWVGGPNLLREAKKKRFARSAKKFSTIAPLQIDFAPKKTHFCPSKIKFLKILGGAMPPPKSALGGAMAPFAPPLWTPLCVGLKIVLYFDHLVFFMIVFFNFDV